MQIVESNIINGVNTKWRLSIFSPSYYDDPMRVDCTDLTLKTRRSKGNYMATLTFQFSNDFVYLNLLANNVCAITLFEDDGLYWCGFIDKIEKINDQIHITCSNGLKSHHIND